MEKYIRIERQAAESLSRYLKGKEYINHYLCYFKPTYADSLFQDLVFYSSTAMEPNEEVYWNVIGNNYCEQPMYKKIKIAI